MWAALLRILTAIFGGAGKRVLAGLGLGIATSAAASFVLNYYFVKAIAAFHFGGVIVPLISILGIAKVDTAFSIIFSAYFVKFTMKSTKLSLTKVTK